MQDFDVDVVVPWVDGNDPAWLEEKNRYVRRETDKVSTGENRFRDWGWMLYWFRSIETCMPWVRKVHFVTWGHFPPGLNLDSEKLHIVRHQDIMPADALPTYNSCAFEMNLHRIEGLADHFIYSNDDLFVISKTKKEDFYDLKTGVPKLSFEEVPLIFKRCDRNWTLISGNDLGIINQYHKKKDISLLSYPGRYLSTRYSFSANIHSLMAKLLYPSAYVGFRNDHGLGVFTKDVFEEVWEKEPELLQRVTHMRFRENAGINPWTFLWWPYSTGRFRPTRLVTEQVNLSPQTIPKVRQLLQKGYPHVICLEDPDYEIDFPTCKKQVLEALEERFPEKSSFEL